MKQVWKWLPIAGVLILGPSTAYAQKKPAPKPAAGASAGATVGTTGAAASGDIELDEPKPAEPAPAEPAAPAAGTGGGICEIDPSACPKELDLKSESKKEVAAEMYAVQQIFALRARRFELQPYWSFTLNDQFVSHPGPGLALNYYITNVLAFGVNGNYYQGLNVDSEFNFLNRRATRVAVPLNEYQANANVNFTYVPMYGKFAGFGNFIFHYDAYIVGGVGMMWTRPIAVIDPDNRKFEYEGKVAFNAGIGLRVFLNRWFAANLEVRDYIYSEKLEALKVDANPTDKTKWLEKDGRLTNHVQAQVGISVFIPFSWDYRLPK